MLPRQISRQVSRQSDTFNFLSKLKWPCLFGCVVVCYVYIVSVSERTGHSTSAIQVVQIQTAADKAVQERPERIVEEIYSGFKCNAPADHTNKLCTMIPPTDLTSQPLITFLEDYKNPCWNDVTNNATKRPAIRCLPYFYVLSAPRCGSTDLYTRMALHPQVINVDTKDVQWLSIGRYVFASDGYTSAPTLQNYTDVFADATAKIVSNISKNLQHEIIFGDFSISTIWDNTLAAKYASMSNTKEKRSAEILYHLRQDTKFIVPIRDPVARAYSDFLYFDREAYKNKYIFHEFVVEAIRTHTECLQYQTIKYCIDYRPNNKGRSGRLFIGLYYYHLQEYFHYFPRKQFLIFKLEDYSKNVTYYLSKIFSFLELDDASTEDYEAMRNVKIVDNTLTNEVKAIGDMLPETRTLLEAFYRPYNEQLVKLIGQEFNYNENNNLNLSMVVM